MTPTVKHGSGNMMTWGCFNDTQVGNLTIVDGRLTAAKYIEALNENLFQSKNLELTGPMCFNVTTTRNTQQK